MPRTISQIAGEFGLARGASGDPFLQQEQAVLSNIQGTLEQLRSQEQERAQATGFGRSSFTEGLIKQQEADILSNIGTEFARSRTEEALRERDFERGIVREQLGADIQSRLLGEQTQAETGLIGTRGAQERQTLAQQISGEERLAQVRGEQARDVELAAIEARGQEQRQTLTQQIAGQAGLSEQEARQQQQRLETSGQQALEQITTQAREERAAQEQQQEFLAQENLLDRQLTSQENQRLQDYRLSSQELEQKFIADQEEIQRQDRINAGIIDLANRGQLSAEDAQAAIDELIGPGAVLTTEDEADLQRVAAASGLSVDDYQRVRAAIGTEQANHMLENPSEYIQDPEALREFQLEIAKIQAEADVAAAEEQGKVLCTELNRQGILPDDIYREDKKARKYYSIDIVNGYLFWGVPLARLMRRSKLITILVTPFAKSWAYHMAYLTGYLDKDNVFGNLLETVGVPICRFIGKRLRKKIGQEC
jgi:hypothetical protein